MLEETAKRILGEDFEKLAKFFIDINQKCQKYEKEGIIVVFASERCQILSTVFSQIFAEYDGEKDLPEYFGKDFSFSEYERIVNTYYTTKSNLNCLVNQFASYYEKNEKFPHLIIVDDLFIHGHNLNNILINLERKLILTLKGKDCPLSIQQNFSQRLEIHPFMRGDIEKSSDCLLLSRFEARLYNTKYCGVRQNHDKTNHFRYTSRQFTTLATVSNVSSNPYSWSIVRKNRSPQPTGILRSQVQEVVTVHSRIRQTTHFLAYPSIRNPKVLFSCQWKHSNLSPYEEDNFYIGTPFAITENISMQNILDCYQKIIADVPQNLKGFFLQYLNTTQEKINWQRLYELNMLVLQGLVINGVYGNSLDKSDLDTKLLEANFINLSNPLDGKSFDADELHSKLQSLWDFVSTDVNQKLTSYLNILYKDVPSLWNVSKYTSIDSKTEGLLLEVLIEEITGLAYKAKAHAKNVYNKGLIPLEKDLAHWEKDCCLVEKLKEILTSYYIDDLGQILPFIAMLLQQIDLGTISLVPRVSSSQESIFMHLHTEDQALLIKPILYKRYMLVLENIVNRYNNMGDVKQMVNIFTRELAKVEPNINQKYLATNLILLIKQLFSIGETISTYNFPLADLAQKWEFDGSIFYKETGVELLEGVEEQRRLSLFFDHY